MVHNGENFEAAVKRQMFEEFGLHVTPWVLLEAYEIHIRPPQRIIPGVLVGGPNSDGQDGVTPTSQGQRSYADQLQAYASNENSVEYNAPLVFVTALLAGAT